MADPLAMFPLGLALLPGQLLPLHVFEPRYRQMMTDVMARADLEGTPPGFGVALIERGRETGGGDLRAMTATRALILQMGQTEDGRYALMCIGTDRLRVVEWLDDEPYPQALVENWVDNDADLADDVALPPDRLEALTGRVRRAGALALELGDQIASPAQPLVDDPRTLLYQLAAMSPLGLADRQALLRAPGAGERLALFEELLGVAEDVLRFRLGSG
jgi:Lon protease-like protein